MYKSICHLFAKYPYKSDSHQSRKKTFGTNGIPDHIDGRLRTVLLTNLDSAQKSNSVHLDEDQVVQFTGGNKCVIPVLGRESDEMAVFDCACPDKVATSVWFMNYKNYFLDIDRAKIRMSLGSNLVLVTARKAK